MAKLHFYYSAMNAGKSTVLLQSNYNYQERGMDTLLLVPGIDTRYGKGKVTSRIGLQAEASIIGRTDNIFHIVKEHKEKNHKLSCILIDEAHFLNKSQVLELCRVVDILDLPVLAYGIRSDFQGEPFEGSIYLLTLSDRLIEIKTICHCGSKAIMNMRVDSRGCKIREGEQVCIGGNETYIATCREHFFKEVSGIIEEQKEKQIVDYVY